MQKEKKETMPYVIEREFLGKVSIAELIRRMLQAHTRPEVKS